VAAAEHAKIAPEPSIAAADLAAAESEISGYLTGDGDEDPYVLHADLQTTMQSQVGIFRDETGLSSAIDGLEALKTRAQRLRAREQVRQFNPGWHLCADVRNLLVCAEAIARSALERAESRGAHSRIDYPEQSPEWGTRNLVVSRMGDDMSVEPRSLVHAPGLDELVETRRTKDAH
jgi:succinate dehydrogenase / fumarate reductase flavoprotein subunit